MATLTEYGCHSVCSAS